MWDQVKQALNQSTAKFLTGLAHLLPGIVALIVALMISIVLAWILAIVTRRVLAGIHFDERIKRWGFASLGEWSPLNSPTRLASRIVACAVMLSGFVIGLAASRDYGYCNRVRSATAARYSRNDLGHPSRADANSFWAEAGSLSLSRTIPL